MSCGSNCCFGALPAARAFCFNLFWCLKKDFRFNP
jgi:hypothetical protein